MTHDAHAPANILLVDDHPSNLLALRAILEPLGQNLVEARSGREALRHVLATDFALILLDVQMPEMDGLETAVLIKQREKSRHIPILFLTAVRRDDLDVFKGYSVGAVDYVVKPVNADILRSKVGVFIELHRRDQVIRRQAELLREKRDQDIEALRRASEQRYRDLADSMPQIVWTATESGLVVFRNRRWYECAGLSPETSDPLGWDAVVHPDDLDAFERGWQGALERGEEWEGELRFGSRSSGLYRWHLVRVLRTMDAHRLGAWIGTSTDIHDRKRAEQALRLLVDASTALTAWTDYETALDQVARAALPLLGDSCLIVVRDLDGAARQAEAGLPAPVDAAGTLARSAVIAMTESIVATQTSEPPAAMAALGFRACVGVPIVARGRTLGAMTCLMREGAQYMSFQVRLAEDIARRVAAAVEAEQLHTAVARERAHLAVANHTKDEFLAVLSHELRTPLNAILGWAEIVQSGGLDELTLARALETIQRNARAQAQLIADLLDVSRIVSGKLAVEPRRVPIRSVVEQAVEAARPAAAAARVTLDVEYGLRGEEVNGDPDRLQQVVGNLLSNAIKFTPPEGRIRVALDRDGDAACVVVTDTGKGIDASFLPHVFERFRQAGEAMTRAHRGLGLGLAIVRHLVDAHGGTVSAESEGVGRGSRFTVKLSILAPETAHTHADEVGAPKPARVPSDALSGVSLLVVEDDDDSRELLELVLRDYGAEVTAVGTASAAFEALVGGEFDVLISDIGLPNEDGYTLVERARALGGARLPAVALTAYVSQGDRARAFAAGFDAHVAKPVRPEVLLAAVTSLAGSAGGWRGRGLRGEGPREEKAEV